MSKERDFAEKFKELRETAGFQDPADLARHVARLGYRKPSYFDIRRYERGDTQPHIGPFAALVDALGLSQREAMMLIRAAEPEKAPWRKPRPSKE